MQSDRQSKKFFCPDELQWDCAEGLIGRDKKFIFFVLLFLSEEKSGKIGN